MPTSTRDRRSLIELAPPVEKAFLIAVDVGDDSGWSATESLVELAALATTAGAEVVGAEWQNRRHVDPNWYVGKGKAEELVAAKNETRFDLLVADDELSPGQQKALEGLLLGRTELIVGHEQVEARLRLRRDELLGLALADVPVGVDVATVLPLRADHLGARRRGEVGQLDERLLGRPAAVTAGVDRDEEGAFDRGRELDGGGSGHGSKG